MTGQKIKPNKISRNKNDLLFLKTTKHRIFIIKLVLNNYLYIYISNIWQKCPAVIPD